MDMQCKNNKCSSHQNSDGLQVFPSIFNDVLAPVAPGPSSSNTVGPYRIAGIARNLLDGKPKYLKVEMSEAGGFFSTFYGMDSDKAFLAGILGKDMLSFNLSEAYEAAQTEGLEYEFEFSASVSSLPSEMGVLTVKSDKETLTLTGVSMGGGEILITCINGKEYSISGKFEEEVLLTGETVPRKIHSVYPLALLHNCNVPFLTAAEMEKYAVAKGVPIWQAAIDYEAGITGLTETDIRKAAADVLKAAYSSIEGGYDEKLQFEGVTSPKASGIRKEIMHKKLFSLGDAQQGCLDALAIMEYSNSHGKIVCMPTGGAAGVIPAAIRSAADSLDKSEEEQINALLTAGAIGLAYYSTHYHGSLGCQAEVGIAASMAAGALASMLTDDIKVVENAAILAMQYTIGQVCDALGGFVQIPCFIRNIASVPLVMTCANYAVLGLETGVSLDEMADAVLRVGEKLREGRINDFGICNCGLA